MKGLARRGTLVVILAGTLLLVSQTSSRPCCRSDFASCDATWSTQAALFEQDLAISGEAPVPLHLAAPEGVDLLVLVRERGIDVLLSMQQAETVSRADSPLQGFGVQRVIVPAAAAPQQIAILAKEPDAPQGSVQVRTIALPATTANTRCAGLQRLLAAADAAQADGWAIGANAPNAPAGEASSFHQASIAGYLDVLNHPQGAPSLQSTLMLSIANSYYRGLGDWEAAESWSRRAVLRHAALGDAHGIAQSRLMQGMALIEVDPGKFPGSLEKAARLLRQSADSHAQRGERREQAQALNNLGIARYFSGDYAGASAAYEAAAGDFRALGERRREWQVRDNLGLIDYELGRLGQAAQTYEQLLAEPALRNHPALFLNVLVNGALVQLEQGEAGAALRLYEQALAMARDTQDPVYEAACLQGIASAYEALGDADMALAHYENALRLRTREAGARYRMETLWSMGDLERRTGKPARALQLDREALELADTDLDQARLRLRIAADLHALGQPDKAMAELDALAARRMPGDELTHARAQLLRGRIHVYAGEWDEGDREIRAALEAFGDYAATEQFQARMALAAIARRRQDTVAAMREVDGAIALAERLRLQTTNPGLRASVHETLRPAFDVKIELLAEARNAATTLEQQRQLAWDALAVAEGARARALHEYANMATPESSGVASLLRDRRALYVQVSHAQARFDSASDEFPTDDPVLAVIRQDLAELRRKIDQIEADLAAGGAVANAWPAASMLEDGAASLPSGITAIQYWLGASRSYAWVLSGSELEMVDLGATTPIVDAARAAQAALRDVQGVSAAGRLSAMSVLSERIWTPLAARAQKGETLVFVPDMVLHYIPFAALAATDAPQRFIVEQHDVATAPSLGLLLRAANRPAHASRRMLIIADPDYRGTAQRLPGTAREAEAIARLAAAQAIDRLQGAEATRDRFLAAPLGDYRFIHIATHALADARIPQLSALRLATSGTAGSDGDGDGRVFAADLLEVKFNAELVVLSACDTALGRDVSGEGVIGLRYVMLARGAQAVVSSLWKVGDRHAQELMTGFYQGLFGNGDATAVALGKTMRAMMARHGRDPAVWAGFDLSVRDPAPLGQRRAPQRL